MRIENAELRFLEIPFRLTLSHGAKSGRVSSDSIVLRVGSGAHAGFGEAVVREYVSGSLGRGPEMRREAARLTAGLLEPLRERDLPWSEVAAHLAGLACDPPALPLLCAVESAVLAAAVSEAQEREPSSDPWTVLGREPVRPTVTYGGVLPFVPLEAARLYIGMCAKMKMTNLKVKVGRDAAYNAAILGLCREVLGGDFDLRVDANSAWSPEDSDEHLDNCRRHGVRLIEQPFPASDGASACAALADRGFSVMADEGVLTAADVRSLASSRGAQVVNLRLSKNGGLGRVLALAAEADACGLSYQLGCMVGETGLLSCMGRLAASLLPRPRYVEGSYDDLLLEANIVSPSFGFGPGGRAELSRGRGMGYRVDEAQLDRFTLERIAL
jgi:L-alanine-DL-glutamate epimerase-like enolase superfamily enzyme